MAVTYPLSLPTSIGMANIDLRAVNAVAISQSPFTYSTQVHRYAGQMWGATITLPRQRRDLIEPWVAFALALNGPFGTFLLGDPNNVAPRGTATTLSIRVNESVGASEIRVTTNGTLRAGDYIQLGTGSDATLHKVLQDVGSGNVTVDIWPYLRKARPTTTTCSLTNTVGLFRLSDAAQTWAINDTSAYTMSFSAIEAIT